MKRLVLAFLLLPSVALAQVDPVTAGAQAMALDMNGMAGRLAGQIAQDRQQYAADQQTIAALRKQVADLTAAQKKPAAPAKK